MPSVQRKWGIRLLPLIPALTVLCISLLRENRGVYLDEVYWIGSCYYYHLLVHEREPFHADWQLLPARENPPMAKYIMGAWLDLFGRRIRSLDLLGSFYLRFNPENGHWGRGAAYQKRKAVVDRMDPAAADASRKHGQVPLDPVDWRVSRALMILVGMLCASCLCWIGLECQTRLGGLLAGLGLAAHPAIREAYAIALPDALALLFSCLTVWLYLALLRADTSGRKRGRWASCGLTVGIGLTLACACGAKMNAVIVVALGLVLWTFLSAAWLRSRHSADRDAVVRLTAGFVLAFALFVLLNPTLYRGFFDGILALFYEHALTGKIQEQFLGGNIHTVTDRFVALGRVVAYSPLLLCAAGVAAMWQGWLGVSGFCSGRERRGIVVVACWWGLSLGLLLAWMPFAWGRYALPLIPPTLLIAGKTAEDLMRCAWRHFVPAAAVVTRETNAAGAHSHCTTRQCHHKPFCHDGIWLGCQNDRGSA